VFVGLVPVIDRESDNFIPMKHPIFRISIQVDESFSIFFERDLVLIRFGKNFGD